MVKIKSNSPQKKKQKKQSPAKECEAWTEKDVHVGQWGGISLFFQVSLLHLFHSEQIFLR